MTMRNATTYICVASMRPRVFPAEDCAAAVQMRGIYGASMRPRVFPAEDALPVVAGVRRLSRFNEAAGIPRGRPPLRVTIEAAVNRLQ